jgi:hypothetical protein
MTEYKRVTKELKGLNLLVDDTKIRLAIYNEDRLGHGYVVQLSDERMYNFNYNSQCPIILKLEILRTLTEQVS